MPLCSRLVLDSRTRHLPPRSEHRLLYLLQHRSTIVRPARARSSARFSSSLSFSPLAFLAFPSTKSRGKKRERERVEYVLCTSRGVHHPASIVCAAGARRLFSVISIVVLTRARGCVGVCVRVCLWGVTCAQRANQDGRRFRNGDVSLPGDCGLQKAAARLRRGERRDQEVALRIRYSRLGVVDAVRQ